eukprot:11340_1
MISHTLYLTVDTEQIQDMMDWYMSDIKPALITAEGFHHLRLLFRGSGKIAIETIWESAIAIQNIQKLESYSALWTSKAEAWTNDGHRTTSLTDQVFFEKFGVWPPSP